MYQKMQLLFKMHDTTIDHSRVTMLKFITSVWHYKWVVWHIHKWSVIFLFIFLFYNFMNIPHYEHSLETWKVSLFLLCAAPCILWHNSTGNCLPLPTAIVSYIWSTHLHVEWYALQNIVLRSNTYETNLTSTTEWKLQTHYHTIMLCGCLSELHAEHIRISIYRYHIKSINKKTL
jgi:hypothetical protein